jgi:hypothetical protein
MIHRFDLADSMCHLLDIRRARTAVALVFLSSTASLACGAESQDGALERPGSVASSLRGGTVIPGAIGVVDFFLYAGVDTIEPSAACTGMMIAPNVVITAAHCFKSLGSKTVASGTSQFTIRYYDPDEGLRLVYDSNEVATWAVFPTYDGGSSTAGKANDDMGVVVIPGVFKNTDYHDYVRLYADPNFLTDLYTKLTVYGAGQHTYSGATDNQLREGLFVVESVNVNHLVMDTRQYDSLCSGDSGAPWVRFASMSGVSMPTVAGVHSNSEKDEDTEGDICTNNDPPNDNAYACRVNDVRIAWLEGAAGISCASPSNTANIGYRRCFETPFIEDVAGEGIDQELATALAMTFL